MKTRKKSPRGNGKGDAARAAERIQVAKAKGRELARRTEAMERLSGDEQTAAALALAEDFAALLAEYPDVYRQPPTPSEDVRRHARELCEADEAARQAIAEHEAASRQTEEARGRLDSAAEQIAREHETSREPKN